MIRMATIILMLSMTVGAAAWAKGEGTTSPQNRPQGEGQAQGQFSRAEMIDLADRLDAIGQREYRAERYEDAAEAFGDAANVYAVVYGEVSDQRVTMLFNQALSLENALRFEASGNIYGGLANLLIENGGVHEDYLIDSVQGWSRVLNMQGRQTDALNAIEQLVAFVEGRYEPDSTVVMDALLERASVLSSMQRTDAALEAAQAVEERAAQIPDLSGPYRVAVLSAVSAIYQNAGQLDRAHQLALEQIELVSEIYGEESGSMANALLSFTSILLAQGENERALEIGGRALMLVGPDDRRLAGLRIYALDLIAQAHLGLGDPVEAEQFSRQSLDLSMEIFGRESPRTTIARNNLAAMIFHQDRYEDSLRLHQENLAESIRVLGEEHSDTALAYENVGEASYYVGDLDASLVNYARAIEIYNQESGPTHYYTLRARSEYAFVLNESGNATAALPHARFAMVETGARIADGRNDIPTDRRREIFEIFAGVAFNAQPDGCAQDSMRENCLIDDAWQAAQWAVQTSASRALSQVSARFASGNDTLALLVAERERAVRERDVAQDGLYQALSLVDEASREAGATAAREQLERVTAQLEQMDARLASEFPEYNDLTNPSPLTIAETQSLLRADEAVLVIFAGEHGTHVFAIDRDGADWARVDLTIEDLDAAVDLLRQSLDPAYGRGPWNAAAAPAATSGLRPFNRDEAYRLYQALLAPVEGRLEGKRHVYAVPSGALSSLPLGVLVTAPPEGADNDPAALADTAWLVREYAMTVLPAPSSLRALSRFGASHASRPFYGIGDPCIGARAGANCDGGGSGAGGSSRGAEPVSFGGTTTRGVFNANADEVRALAALPNTRPELIALAQAFGADPDRDLLVGGAATEEALQRDGALRDHRVIAFATHGLVADELPNLVEPALVLTPPDMAHDGIDGLLTASEIARDLDLDADWVILSACNTAAPAGSGAESLSGLASAFLYAGARSLLVSHWVVDDTAARRITTGTLDAMNDDPGAGRSEALRRSVLTLMQDPAYAHPAMWAPFVLVGENRPVSD